MLYCGARLHAGRTAEAHIRPLEIGRVASAVSRPHVTGIDTIRPSAYRLDHPFSRPLRIGIWTVDIITGIVPIVGPFKNIAHHIVGPEGTGAVPCLIAINSPGGQNPLSISAVKKSHRIGAEYCSKPSLKRVVTLKVVSSIGIQTIAPGIFASVVAAGGALTLCFRGQAFTGPLAKVLRVVPRHQSDGVDLARSRVLQNPLGNLHPGGLLVFAPLRHRDLVFIDQIGIEVNPAYRLFVEGLALHTTVERAGRDQHHLGGKARGQTDDLLYPFVLGAKGRSIKQYKTKDGTINHRSE